MEVKQDIFWRLKLLYFGVVILALCILVQAFRIAVINREEWIAKSEEATVKMVNIEATRGNIYSDDGNLMATSIPIYEMRMDMKTGPLTDEIFNSNVDSLALCLAETFKDKTKEQYLKDLKRARINGNRYYLIKKNVSHQNKIKAMNFPILRLGRFKGGIRFEQESKREFPYRHLAKRTIGRSVENGPKVGLEGAYDDELKGIGGQRLMRRMSGNVWKPLSDKNEIDPEDGYDIVSTIDIGIQDLAENALMKQLKKHQATAGCVVLMEVETGHVKAIANLQRNKDSLYVESLNHAITSSTEPGSTFKLVNLIALLEDGLIKETDSIDTRNGIMRYGNYVVKDSHEGGYGKITVARGLEVSSNTVFTQIINDNYKEKPAQYIDRLRSMGIDQKLGIELQGEGDPFISSPSGKFWSKYSLPAMSQGYEVKLTPLQTLTFYNAVANNGKMMKPLFVKEIRKRQTSIKKFEPIVLNPSICSPTTIAKVKPILEGVVEQGTAMNLRSSHYKIAGKTGTAKIVSDEGSYKHAQYQASFAGYFPANKPKYSCIVMVYNPSVGGYYGNVVAGNVFKEIADKIYAQSLDLHEEDEDVNNIVAEHKTKLPSVKYGFAEDLKKLSHYLNISFENDGIGAWGGMKVENDKAILKKYTLQDDIVPNVRGMGLRDALYMLENSGLNVQVKGRGTVRSQSINPGTKIQKNQTIIIDLT
jgi:cell division protein FtsI (penicillin-binding protein 3)